MKRLTFYRGEHNLLTILFLLWATIVFVVGIDCRKSNRKHQRRQLNHHHSGKLNLEKLFRDNVFDEKLFRSILGHILRPRSINTLGHEKVRQYITNTLRDLNPRWRVEEDVFRTRTPAGPVKFRNIIATYVPEFGCMKKRLKRIVLACHYDSLYPTLVKGKSSRPPINNWIGFTGATDAAVSCALLIYFAKSLQNDMEKIWLNNNNNTNNGHGHGRKPSTTLQLVFFDGEESLLEGTEKSAKKKKSSKSGSLYGSRHLANKWEANSQKIRERNPSMVPKFRTNSSSKTTTKRLSNQMIVCDGIQSKLAKIRSIQNGTQPAKNNKKNKKMNKRKKNKMIDVSILSSQNFHTIDGIKLFVLLDLIGASGNRFYNTNLNTSFYFQQLALIEKHLLELNGTKIAKPLFQQNPSFFVSLVRDDHLPFIVRNVPVLHLIPHPFPRTWHSIEDNIDNLNFNNIGRFATIMQLFLLNLLQKIRIVH